MTREQLIEVMAKSAAESHRIRMCYQNKWGDLSEQTKHYWLKTGENILDTLTAAGMVVVPAERGIGFFDAVERSLIALCEKEHEDQLTREFCAWNKDRRAMTEAANG